jgi:hypothetical protein
MPRELTISEAYLAGLCSTSICYGISCATYLALVTRFVGTGRRWTLQRIILFAVATGMWVDATVGVGQMLRHMLNAFIDYKGPGGSDMGFSDIRDPMNYVHVRDLSSPAFPKRLSVLQQALTYPIQTAMGDSFLVYRLWVVYDRSWLIIILPLIILGGDIASGFGITAAELGLRSEPNATATDPKIVPWTTAFFTITMCLNVICTGIVASLVLCLFRRLKWTSSDDCC